MGRVFTPDHFQPETPAKIMADIVAIIRAHGLTPVGQPGLYLFDDRAFTGFVMLQESHISLHTWYERGYVDLDVYVCNVTRDNSRAAEHIFEQVAALFKATTVEKQIIRR